MTKEELLEEALGTIRATIEEYRVRGMDGGLRTWGAVRSGCASLLGGFTPAGEPLTQIDLLTLAALATMLAVDVEWSSRSEEEGVS